MEAAAARASRIGPNGSVGIAVEPDDELDRALRRAAAAAGPGDLGFPICLFLVESAKRLAPSGDRRPRLARTGRMGDQAAGRNRHLTRVGRLALGHAEATRLFS